MIQQFNFIQEDLKNLFKANSVNDLAVLKGSSVMITGGAGFMGLWLSNVIYYLNENHDFNTKVYVIDRDIEKAKTQAPHLFNSSLFDFKRTDTRYLVELPREINYIVHAAGSPDSREHATYPVDVMTTIATGTENLLRAAERLSDMRMILNLSSSLVYGSFSNVKNATKEDDMYESVHNHHSNFYSEAKRYSETIASACRQQFRVPVATMRPFAFMGPFQALTGPWALNNFINEAINGHTIKILGDGSTVRSLMYGSDAAFWVLKTLILAESGALYNLGSSEAVTLKDLAQKVQANLSVNKDVMFYAGTAAAHKSSYMVPDTTKVCTKFNLKITVALDQAVARTIQWYLLNK